MFWKTLRGLILAMFLRCCDGDDHPPAPVPIFHVYCAGVVLRGPHSKGGQQRRRRREGWMGGGEITGCRTVTITRDSVAHFWGGTRLPRVPS